MNARRNSFLVNTCYMFEQYFAPKGSDKICMMTTRLACIELLRARIGEWTITWCWITLGYDTLPVTDKLAPMELDASSSWSELCSFSSHKLIRQDTAVSIASSNNCIVQLHIEVDSQDKDPALVVCTTALVARRKFVDNVKEPSSKAIHYQPYCKRHRISIRPIPF